MHKSISAPSVSLAKTAAKKSHKLSTKEKISQKLSSTHELKIRYSPSPTSASKNGNYKRTQLQFHMNPHKNTNCKNFISTSQTSPTLSAPKLTISYAGRSLKNAQSTISHHNRSSALSRSTKPKSVCYSKPQPVVRNKTSTMSRSTTRWKFMI